MNFKYRKFPVDPANNPFSNKKSSLRPVIQIDFETHDGNFHYFVLSFSYDMEKLPYGLLGQDGFFDRWIIKFEYHKENVELKEILKK